MQYRYKLLFIILIYITVNNWKTILISVFINALYPKSMCQAPFLFCSLLNFCSLILEPNLELVLCHPKLTAEVPPPLLCEVLAGLELPHQPTQLLHVESSSLFLVLTGAWVYSWLLLCLPCSSTRRTVRITSTIHPGRNIKVTMGQSYMVSGVGEIHC